jgi:hypothetical protein
MDLSHIIRFLTQVDRIVILLFLVISRRDLLCERVTRMYLNTYRRLKNEASESTTRRRNSTYMLMSLKIHILDNSPQLLRSAKADEGVLSMNDRFLGAD